MNYAKLIDHTYLKPEGTSKEIDKLIKEAIEFSFGSICINSSWIKYAKEKLKNNKDIKIVSVVGFPLGACISQIKVQEAKLSIDHGADEIDMVINIGRFKDGQYDYVLNEIKKVKEACGNKILKVIIETALLKDWEIEKATSIVLASGADFIKTSTGFSYRGADKKDIEIFNKVIGSNKLKIKAAGGIKTMDDIKMYVEMGVERFGTSSSVAIFTGEKTKNNSSY
ncbi:MAG: deoxyribose-phosphate aldolase [Mycoplasmataceae bacterium]|nr:deoxyribose-phosphate aldolase [Mycoplasmataceae bacterium]MBR4025734.1 deoxyribose-phosphate aldolase [Mycoplasmataceae bacterium]